MVHTQPSSSTALIIKGPLSRTRPAEGGGGAGKRGWHERHKGFTSAMPHPSAEPSTLPINTCAIWRIEKSNAATLRTKGQAGPHLYVGVSQVRCQAREASRNLSSATVSCRWQESSKSPVEKLANVQVCIHSDGCSGCAPSMKAPEPGKKRCSGFSTNASLGARQKKHYNITRTTKGEHKEAAPQGRKQTDGQRAATGAPN